MDDVIKLVKFSVCHFCGNKEKKINLTPTSNTTECEVCGEKTNKIAYFYGSEKFAPMLSFLERENKEAYIKFLHIPIFH